MINRVLEMSKAALVRWCERDGTWYPTDDHRMRRWFGGAWQHREMTDEEAREHAQDMAW